MDNLQKRKQNSVVEERALENEPLITPEFIEVTERRTDREEGFKLGNLLREKGLSSFEAARVASYIYNLGLSMDDLLGESMILEAGANDGHFKNGLKKLGSEATVVTLDMNPGEGIDHVARIESMPFLEDGKFDLVIASWAIPNDITPDLPLDFMAQEIEELYRVTKKGGRMLFVPIYIFNYIKEGKDKAEKVSKGNRNNVMDLLSMFRDKNIDLRVEIFRQFENLYSEYSLNHKDYDANYSELLIVHK
ncbi:MAG: methyltransferase domain-containing protein [Candidatus Pacebacteria bacterium]|mgnify:CR=1 FL=1|jgi:hypothetical protein|nr:methyltransferase domain-containing protein [Candidatus Paceibacterota bacterium]MBT4652151.1 methyltransferase domain-containing protein [Candidatus Paceibacterota bacterium]MBT6756689.1 methyltransferase domain-containing protein [Candidatus Paceibacterota bacterium]MBT6920959.1 methyltransferase domain-containing protein [Candidatus Paceibacterota bacterium]